MQRKIRVLVGKPGLDGHDRGAKVVAAALRDAGMEVIYTGLHQSPEQIVEAAIQEDVDVVALSILSGAHMTLFPEVRELLRSRGVGDKLVTGGGIIPPEDMETLAKQGVGKLFGPGASTQDIVVYIRDWFASVNGADSLMPLPESFARSRSMDPAPQSAASHRAAHRPVRDPAPRPAGKAQRGAAKPARAAARAKPKAARAARKPAGAAASRSKPAAKRGTKRPAKRAAARR